jgi:cyanophycinase
MQMSKKLIISFLFSFLVLGIGAQQQAGGSLVIIGGALQPDNHAIYNTFIQLGGGKKKIRIAIIPAASSAPVKSGEGYIKDFVRYGVSAKRIKVFPLAVMDDESTKRVDESKWSINGNNKKLALEILKYSAVFFVGGDQARYAETLMTSEGKDTPLLASIRKIYKRGGVLGGTSAGAAIMTDPMICGGTPMAGMLQGAKYQADKCPDTGGVRLMKGLGFLPFGLVDQHFLKRGRAGRMVAALFNFDHTNLGIGVDEDTAVVYRSINNTLEVVGRSGVLLMDIKNGRYGDIVSGHKRDVLYLNLLLHYLESGDVYDIKQDTFTINKQRKLIENGKEYYKISPLKTDIFGKDSIKNIMTTGLVDNQNDHAKGIAFDFSTKSKGLANGVRLVFRSSHGTRGYFGKIDGRQTYSALHVYLDIVPLVVTVEEVMNAGKH